MVPLRQILALSVSVFISVDKKCCIRQKNLTYSVSYLWKKILETLQILCNTWSRQVLLWAGRTGLSEAYLPSCQGQCEVQGALYLFSWPPTLTQSGRSSGSSAVLGGWCFVAAGPSPGKSSLSWATGAPQAVQLCSGIVSCRDCLQSLLLKMSRMCEVKGIRCISETVGTAGKSLSNQDFRHLLLRMAWKFILLYLLSLLLIDSKIV